jgi:hypothetical protein
MRSISNRTSSPVKLAKRVRNTQIDCAFLFLHATSALATPQAACGANFSQDVPALDITLQLRTTCAGDTNMISTSRSCAKLAKSQARCWRAAEAIPARNCRIWTRGIAATAKIDKKAIEKLPLAGIRVLDMTRVLAGVGVFLFQRAVERMELTPQSHIVHRY